MEFLNFEGLAYFKNKENSQIAPVESTTTASQAYEIGQYFWYEGKLYEATAAIALGDTFVTSGDSANCELADIADDISDARERISTLEGQVTDLETNKANIDGYYSEMTVGNAEQIVSTVGVEDKTPYNFRTAGGSVDIGDREEDMVVGGTVAWNQLVTTDTNVSKTKSGDIVTVEDAVAENAEDLVVSFEPQQDLHGYANPWPSGASANLFPINNVLNKTGMVYPVSFVKPNDVANYDFFDGGYGSDGHSYNTAKIDKLMKLPAGDYCASFTTSPTSAVRLSTVNPETGAIVTDIPTTSASSSATKLFSFTLAEESYVTFRAGSGTGSFTVSNPMLNAGTTLLDFVPNENICPITGFTGCNINRADKNLTPITSDPTNPDLGMWSSGGGTAAFAYDSTEEAFYTNNHRATGFFPPITGTYKVSFYAKLNPAGDSVYAVLGEGNKFPPYASSYTNEYVRYSASFSLIKGKRLNLTLYDTLYFKDFQIELGDTLTAHEDYDTDIYSVSWQTEAGTVYGGTWNPVNGKLIPDRLIYTLDGSDDEGITSGGYGAKFKVYPPEAVRNAIVYPSATNIMPDAICNQMKPVTQSATWQPSENIFSMISSKYIYFNLANNVSTIQELRTYLATENIVFCFKLLESARTEYTLTPTQITMLSGTNNVWNSIGSTQMTYLGTLNEITAQSGHKYLTRVNGSSTVVNGAGQIISGEKARDNIFDLTQMFGSSIADYVYSLENTSAGDGVTWFTDLFPKPYYSYNAGQLMSVNTSAHKTVGFNAWDEESENGYYDVANNGAKANSDSWKRCKNLIPCLPGMSYYFMSDYSGGESFGALIYYDASRNQISYKTSMVKNITNTTPDGCYYMSFYAKPAWFNSHICINLSWDGERDGEYEAYEEHTYALDESLTLRGIPKLDASNKLYYDGDTYEDNGTVTRRYGVVDLGTLTGWGYSSVYSYVGATVPGKAATANFFCARYPNNIGKRTASEMGSSSFVDGMISYENNVIRAKDSTLANLTSSEIATALSGVYLIYELAEPTTEEAEPYANPQIVDDFGTEEYVDYSVLNNEREVAIPVGHVTMYQANLRAKLEMVPNSPDGDGDYIVRQYNGVNEYVQLVIPEELPESPTSNGTYILQATVSGGTTTLAWVSAT